MGCTLWRTAAVAVMLTIGASSLAAQSGRSGAFGGFGLSWGTAGMYANGRSDLKPGPTVIGRVGIRRNDRPLLVADGEYQIYRAPFPGRDAEFRALTVTAGIHLFAGTEFYLLPAVGMQFRSWSGEERVTSSDSGLLGSLGMGYHLRFGQAFSLAPEVMGRLGDASGAGANSYRAVNFRVIATWRF